MKRIRKIKEKAIIKRSRQFDGAQYVAAYADIAQSKKWGKRPLEHYMRFGGPEGRFPRPGFDGAFYLFSNPDVKQAGLSPFAHYLKYGYGEGRLPCANSDFFVEWTYFNPPASRWNLKGRLRNWRDAWEIKKSHRFSPEWYWGRNPDVLAKAQNSFWWQFRNSRIKPFQALGKAMTHPIRHFVWWGVYEGRHPSTEFDPQFYLRTHVDVRSGRINPFVHYLRHGIHENRAPRNARENEMHEIGLEIPDHGTFGRADPDGFLPKVSVIVPNYNHGDYLPQRLDSIYHQTYKNMEVILLDDGSQDNSQDILRGYAQNYSQITQLAFNDVNSGNVFQQWHKGIDLAQGELVWIAESDDFCDSDFLEKLVWFFRDEAVMLAYSNVSFVNDRGKAISEFAYEHYLAPVGSERWQCSRTAAAHREVERAFGILNVVPNTSGCIFRRPSHMPLFDDPQWLGMKICGDWVFYLHLIRNGKISFCAETFNYYRFHHNNASQKTYGNARYYQEHEMVASTVARLYRVPDTTLKLHAENVHAFWRQQAGDQLKAQGIEHFYDMERIRKAGSHRTPSVMIAVYSFSTGGGEVQPIRLANALYKRGWGVTVMEFLPSDRNMGVRRMLNAGIPVVSCKDPGRLRQYIRDFGIDLFNSHHPSLQNFFSDAFPDNPRPRHVAVTHGLYDALGRQELAWCLPKVYSSVDHWVYVADKNLLPFKTFGLYAPECFTKLPNGMERPKISPISRSELGLAEDAFVLCLVSRAMEQKGWREAMEIVTYARKQSGHDIQLLLIGDGEEYEKLKEISLPDYVHLLGFRNNPWDYYAASDMGFLPSRFKGESFPLTIIEAFFAGKPVIASDLGEIRNMLDAGDGELAGAVFALNDWHIPIERAAEWVSGFAADPHALSRAAELGRKKSCQFEIERIAEQYAVLFSACCGETLKSTQAQCLGPDASKAVPDLMPEPTLRGTGICPICLRPTVYLSHNTENDWFNSYRCQHCDSLPRDRAVQHLLDRFYPDWRNRSIHESSPCNALLEQRVEDYSASQYYPDRRLGETVGRFRNEDLENMTFEDNRFDFIVALEVMEHLFHPDRAMGEMMRCVKPGGAVIFTTCPGDMAKSRPRATIDPKTGKLSHLTTPVYHGNPVAEGSLLTWDFGRDFIDLIAKWSGVEPIVWSEKDDRIGLPEGGLPWVFILPKKG